MRTLSRNQILALRLLHEGKKRSEICKITELSSSSVSEAINRGRGNIYRAIKILQTAVENNILDEDQVQKLKLVLGKI